MLSGTPAQRAMAQSSKMYATPSMSPYLLTKIDQLINCGLIILGKANMTVSLLRNKASRCASR
jgi:hypothetical protein